jgi:hypothetical protein
VEDRIDCEGKKGERKLTRIEPDECHHCKRKTSVSSRLRRDGGRLHTQILNVLVSSKHQCALLLGSRVKTSSVSFVNNNAIGGCCCHECQTIRSLCPCGEGIERDIRKEVSEDTEEESQVSANN